MPNYDLKPTKKTTLGHTLELLNIAFKVNVNVKNKAYTTTQLDRCGRCGCTKEDNPFWDVNCLRSDFRECYFEQTEVDYYLRDKMYNQKQNLIKKIINNIKNYSLPIKYGKNNGIIYFEFKGTQCSFHDPKNYFKGLKKFAGSWTGVRNERKPFFRPSTLKKYKELTLTFYIKNKE